MPGRETKGDQEGQTEQEQKDHLSSSVLFFSQKLAMKNPGVLWIYQIIKSERLNDLAQLHRLIMIWNLFFTAVSPLTGKNMN